MSHLGACFARLSPEQQEGLLHRLKAQEVKSNASVGLGIHKQDYEENEFSLSLGQQVMWLAEQLLPEMPMYNVSVAFRIGGGLRLDALETAVSSLVANRAILAAVFTTRNEDTVLPTMADIWSLIDYTALAVTEREDALATFVDTEAKRPFKLSTGPLFRATVVKMAAEDHVLLLTLHHIVFEEWSLENLLQELTLLYQQAAMGETIESSSGAIQDQHGVLEKGNQDERSSLNLPIADWKRDTNEDLPALELPLDQQRPLPQTYTGRVHSFEIEASLVELLKKLSRELGVSLHLILMTAYTVLLARYSGQEDIIVGSANVNRKHLMFADVFDYFADMVAVRTDLSGNPTFVELLKGVRQERRDKKIQEALSFAQLIKRFSEPNPNEQAPIFQTSFVLQKEAYQLNIPGLKTMLLPQHNGLSQFDLSLEMWAENGRLHGQFEYNTDIFHPDTIKRLTNHFCNLLQNIQADPTQPIQQIPMLTPSEREMILVEWNDTSDNTIPEACLHWHFEEQVAKTPHAIAVQFVDEYISYQELNDKANQLAHYLQTLGAGPGRIVGISMQRTPDLLVAIWGILKSGASYVPIDPKYPPDRVQYMLDDADVIVLITQESLLTNLPQVDTQLLCLDKQWDEIVQQPSTPVTVAITPNDPAYVIYTSGSTGKPKGVVVRHKSIVNYVDTCRTTYNITPEDRYLQFSSISFDISVEEIYTTHLSGASLVLRTAKMVDMYELLQRCHEWGITLIHMSTAYWHELVLALDQDVGVLPPSLRVAIIGGEKVLPARVATWLRLTGASPRLINWYGPTEVTVSATMLEMSNIEIKEDVMPDVTIGWTIRNVQSYILNKYREPVPIGVPGELYLGGIQVAQGYLNRPELTADRFVKNLFSNDPEERLYKTGDLVKYRPNGEIEFIGRMDFQLKIRGYRIELGEIQAVLNQFSLVQESLLLAVDDTTGMKQLVAYCVPVAGETLTSVELNTHMRENLPDYMLPSAFVIMEAFPLTQNGKVNRHALPDPTDEDRLISTEYVAPRTPTEQILTAIWTDILGMKQVGINDDIFEMGGHSLLFARIIARIRVEFGVALSLDVIFNAPTVALLADKVDAFRDTLDPIASLSKRVVAVQPMGEKTPFFHMGGAVILRQLSKYLGEDQPLYGVLEQTLEEDQPLHTSVEAIVADCVKAIQSVQPEGPYMLGGLCFGGVVALEIARALQTQGHEIALLTLIDTYNTVLTVQTGSEKRKIERLTLRMKHHWNKSTGNGANGIVPYFARKINKNLYKNHKKYMKKFYKVTGQPLPQYFRDIYETNLVAGDQYIPSIFDGHAVLFQATERPDWFEYDSTMGWGNYFIDGVEVYVIPGNHLSIYDDPNVQAFGDRLKICIEVALSKHESKNRV